MTRGQNIAMKKPRRLKITNNIAQLTQARDLTRITPTWMYLRKGVHMNHDLIIPSPMAFPINPNLPCRYPKTYL